ncbi:MAG: thioesterase family protein [Ruminococcaceae bacterium]|nr:thioesterase family protein [Oscillospiraceae bacterium]
MEIGLKNTKQIKVEEKDTALTYGSGTLKVFATPAMIALMENTAMNAVSAYLEEGEATVGTEINVKHLSATPVGGTVTCEAELAEIDGRRLVFNVKAFDDKGIIGEGTHQRFIVKTEKFLVKTYDKLK